VNEAGGGRAGRPVETAAIASILTTSILFVVALAAAVAQPGLWRIGAAGALLILLLERLIEREDELRSDAHLGS
jgi:hypothetical protein